MHKKYFGVMLDMSRNAVMKVEKVNEFVDYISSFGYNMLQLYTEDTYKVDNEPYFGCLRGGYSKDEIRAIDAHCKSKGVELIPCIQTLAHVKTIFKWQEYLPINDCDDILLIDDERTYKLIENMFATLADSFSSRKIHIGMDEAHMVGFGKYKDIHGIVDRYELLKKHLGKVVDIAKKYGFEPIMWSDMFFRMANKGAYGGDFGGKKVEMPESVIKNVPDVGLVFWDYYHTQKGHYDQMLKLHEQFGKDVWFAGGAWSWVGFTPANRYSLQTMKPAMDVCKKRGVDKIFFTLWGDNGKECSFFALLPALYYLKRYYDGVTDRKQIASEFESLTGENFESMMSLDAPNLVGDNKEGFRNPSKYMLYNDPFFGWMDTVCQDGVPAQYKKIARSLALKAKKSKNFGYIYQNLSNLCKVLSIKYDLGVRVRKAYKDGDRQEMQAVSKDLSKIEKLVKAFYKSFNELWHKENKPHGFEVQDIRLGGLIQRLKSCKQRLDAYLKGEISRLEDLEDELLDFWGNFDKYDKQTPCYPNWGLIASASPVNG
ncbi:MAG: beta-N-acetylhexosaminidase [Clostridia bacterium]|nr:beta-N-acetylhexosaminidase [Clostridia bacterium]